MSMKLALALLAAPAPACDLGRCQTVQQDGPGLTGTASYTTADGATLAATLGDLRMSATDAVRVSGRVTDEWGRERQFHADVQAIAPMTSAVDLAGHGEACLPRETGGDDVCAPLTGTVDVRALAADCYEHESGIGACAETIDLTLHVRSDWEGTTFVVDGEMTTVGSWVDTRCDD
jgi:hypothetical protein